MLPPSLETHHLPPAPRATACGVDHGWNDRQWQRERMTTTMHEQAGPNNDMLFGPYVSFLVHYFFLSTN
jgi:hypothetical protein